MANVIKQLKSTMPRMDTLSIDSTMLGVTTAGPALFAQALSAANKALGFGISIFPMHKGVRKRVTAKRRPLRFTCGHTSTLAMISRVPDATESATEEAEEDIGAVTVEADFQEMMNAVVDDLLPKHPLIYDSQSLRTGFQREVHHICCLRSNRDVFLLRN